MPQNKHVNNRLTGELTQNSHLHVLCRTVSSHILQQLGNFLNGSCTSYQKSIVQSYLVDCGKIMMKIYLSNISGEITLFTSLFAFKGMEVHTVFDCSYLILKYHIQIRMKWHLFFSFLFGEIYTSLNKIMVLDMISQKCSPKLFSWMK